MSARYVADPTALREARCECGHPVDVHVSAGCNTYPGCDCRRDIAAALLASGVVQPREDAVREALLEAADDYPWRDAGGRTDAPGGARHWLRARAVSAGANARGGAK